MGSPSELEQDKSPTGSTATAEDLPFADFVTTSGALGCSTAGRRQGV
jgi:hypothetical protein